MDEATIRRKLDQCASTHTEIEQAIGEEDEEEESDDAAAAASAAAARSKLHAAQVHQWPLLRPLLLFDDPDAAPTCAIK